MLPAPSQPLPGVFVAALNGVVHSQAVEFGEYVLANDKASLPLRSCTATFAVDAFTAGASYAAVTTAVEGIAEANVRTTVEPLTTAVVGVRAVSSTKTVNADLFNAGEVANVSSNESVTCEPETVIDEKFGGVLSGPSDELF